MTLDLRRPHGFLLWRGKKTAVLTPGDLPAGEELEVATGDERFGVAVLGDPIRMLASEADRKEYFGRHRVWPQEREAWWPGETRFNVYPVERFDPYREIRRAFALKAVAENDCPACVNEGGGWCRLHDELVGAGKACGDWEEFVDWRGAGGDGAAIEVEGTPAAPIAPAPDQPTPGTSGGKVRGQQGPEGAVAAAPGVLEEEKKAEVGEMPYEKFKDGDRWCVRKADTKKLLHCYEGRGAETKADKYLAALRIHAEAGEKEDVDPGEFEVGQEAPDDEGEKKRGNIEGLAKHLAKRYGGDPHFHTKCMGAEELADYPEENRAAICARAHKIAIGIWPGEHGGENPTGPKEGDEPGEDEKARPPMAECPHCGKPVPEGTAKCLRCGKEIDWEEKAVGEGGTDTCVCPDCGAEAEHERGRPCNDVECPECGEPMAGQAEKAGRRIKKSMKDRLRDAYQTIKEMLTWADYDEEVAGPTMLERMKASDAGLLLKSVSGDPWIVAWSSNAFKDRDDEMFSTAGLERYVQAAERKGDRGHFNFWHVPGTDFAEKRWQGVVGRFLVETGPFLDTPTGRAAKKFFTDHQDGHPTIAPEGWGCSVEYRYLPEQKRNKVYDDFWVTRTSVLPRLAAANTRTRGGVTMALTEAQRKALAEIFPEEAESLIAETEAETKKLEEAGVEFKALSPEKAAAAIRKLAGDTKDEALKGKLEELAKAMWEEKPGEPDEEDEMDEEKEVQEEKTAEIDVEALAAEMVKHFDVQLQPLQELQEQVAEQSKVIAGLQKALKQEERRKDAELPRMVLSLEKRASQADETALDEGDPLLKAKPAEPETPADGSGAQHFFGKKK